MRKRIGLRKPSKRIRHNGSDKRRHAALRNLRIKSHSKGKKK